MSNIHQQDVDGCNYTMWVIGQYENRIITWSHTPNETDKYDMDWTCFDKYESGFTYEVQDENKDRRWGWKKEYNEDIGKWVSVRDYDKPQFLSSFSSQMFNYEKYEPMMALYEKTGQKPFYTAGYLDGIWICDLTQLPKDKIYTDEKDGGWRVVRYIEKLTMSGRSYKVPQYRFNIPNEYGKVLYNKEFKGY